MKRIHQDGAFLDGNASSKKVTLFRKNLAFGNSYRPLFVGRFVEIDGKSYLHGSFRMGMFARMSLVLCVLCVLFYELVVIFLTINGDFSGDSLPRHMLRLLFLPAGTALSLGFLMLIKKISRKDVKWISDHIVDILTPDSRT